ncbi:MAG: cell division protein FtsZ [Clostridiaceae bacterium]|jgi:cell division protein FtsZ|nr:cell division protein FtsZ [Clostridiaceae bacterium]
MEDFTQFGAKILVVGVGGGGNNAVNNMIDSGVSSCRYVAMNTDRQALMMSKADVTLQLGEKLTSGLGAGADPDVGERAAEESRDKISALLQDVDLLFIAAGMGGGTGTGAAPVIAEIARSLNLLTIAVVTKPFDFEGEKRMANAEAGINKLRKFVDTLLVIPNQKLVETANRYNEYGDKPRKSLPVKEAFKIADDVLKEGVRAITDLVVKPALINLDFADVRTVIKDKGIAHMGIGVGKGERKHYDAAHQAVSSALLETRIEGATALILHFRGGEDTTIDEIKDASEMIKEVLDENPLIIWGLDVDENMHDEIRLTVIATGFKPLGAGSLRPKLSKHPENMTRLHDFNGYTPNSSRGQSAAEQQFPRRDERGGAVQQQPPRGQIRRDDYRPVADETRVDNEIHKRPVDDDDDRGDGYRGYKGNREDDRKGGGYPTPRGNRDDDRKEGYPNDERDTGKRSDVTSSRMDVNNSGNGSNIPPFLRKLRGK